MSEEEQEAGSSENESPSTSKTKYAAKTRRNVHGLSSSLTVEDIPRLRKEYDLSDNFEIRIPESGEVASTRIANFICVYEKFFHSDAGLQFPIHPLLRQILADCDLTLAQLMPNCIRQVLGFVIACCCEKIEVDLKLFYHFFSVLPNKKNPGRYMFTFRKGKKFLSKLKASNKYWEDKFFFVSGPWEFDAESEREGGRIPTVPTRWVDRERSIPVQTKLKGNRAEEAKCLRKTSHHNLEHLLQPKFYKTRIAFVKTPIPICPIDQVALTTTTTTDTQPSEIVEPPRKKAHLELDMVVGTSTTASNEELLKLQLSNAKEIIERLESKVHTLLTQTSSLKDKNSELYTENEKLYTENEKLSDYVDDLSRKVKDFYDDGWRAAVQYWLKNFEAFVSMHQKYLEKEPAAECNAQNKNDQS